MKTTPLPTASPPHGDAWVLRRRLPVRLMMAVGGRRQFGPQSAERPPELRGMWPQLQVGLEIRYAPGLHLEHGAESRQLDGLLVKAGG